MNARLFEHAAFEHGHFATSAGRATVVGAAPSRAYEFARSPLGAHRVLGQPRLQRFETRANLLAQRFKPCARALLARLEGEIHRGCPRLFKRSVSCKRLLSTDVRGQGNPSDLTPTLSHARCSCIRESLRRF